MDTTPLLAFYGDDFTGSTDAMEVLAAAGVPTLLFLDTPPDAAMRAAARRHRAIGIAGTSRAMDPAWMARELPAVFGRLAGCGAPLLHYKVCSTFDSSPTVGSIGAATQVVRAALGTALASPVVVGAPALRRYTAFGELFAAAADGRVHRIDRHPTMSVHPVTPMHEADLRRHLARQAPTLRVGLWDLATQQRADAAERLQDELAAHDAVLLDVLDEASQSRVGAQVDALGARAAAVAGGPPVLCIGSSGLQYALVRHWRERGLHGVAPTAWTAPAVDRIAAVSGSCSPVTAGQIDAAEDDGFACLRADALALLDEGGPRAAEVDRLEAAALAALGQGRSVLVYTARGPQDPAVRACADAVAARGATAGARALAGLGAALGALLARLRERAGLQRVAVAGGDTSGQVMQAFGLVALTMRATLSPGVPLCNGHAEADGPCVLELALKGGQLGGRRFFATVRAGRLLG